MNALNFQHVTKEYNVGKTTVKALDDVSLDILDSRKRDEVKLSTA